MMERLSSVPFSAPEELRAVLAPEGHPELVPAGTILFSQGDPVKGIYIVNRGRVRLSLTDLDGQAVCDRMAQSGSVLGFPASMTGNPYSLTAEVVEDAEVVFVPRERALEKLRRHPSLCFTVVEILAQEVGDMRRETATTFSAH